MTMLDRMRQHRSWLKWSLAIVCVAMVVFFIPNFLTDPASNMAATGTVAVVEGREIRADEFQRTYQAQIQAYRSAYGANMSDQLLRQLGVEQQILQQMVDERAALAEAERLDVTVSDDEVRQRILAIPSFQENGAFIGEDRYRQLLAMQRPPMTPSDFEEEVRRSLVVEKLRDRKSTRQNSSHSQISYAVFCLKKKKNPDREVSFLEQRGNVGEPQRDGDRQPERKAQHENIEADFVGARDVERRERY